MAFGAESTGVALTDAEACAAVAESDGAGRTARSGQPVWVSKKQVARVIFVFTLGH